MKNIIAYSLFGSDPRYTINMIINIELALKIYPTWEVWVYFDNTVPKKILDKLQSYSNVKIFNMSGRYKIGWTRLMWRFHAYDDTTVNSVIFRDADSYLTQREKDAVDQWLSTGKSLHIMREVYPGHNSLMMAGMWGIKRNNKIHSIATFIRNYTGEDNYAMDQTFLNTIVYPMFKDDMVVHDGNSELRYKDATHIWPSITYDDQYIGRTQYPPCPESGQLERFNQLSRELL
jgi:hypothetical protein